MSVRQLYVSQNHFGELLNKITVFNSTKERVSKNKLIENLIIHILKMNISME